MMDDVGAIARQVSIDVRPGVVRGYRPRRFDLNGFDADCHPEVRVMHREAQWFVNDVVNKVRPRRWLALLGASGVGKTHLGRAISAVVSEERPGLLAQCWSWQEVVVRLRRGEWEFLDYLIWEVDVLVVDDVGAENVSPAILAALNRLADGRLGRWTVWTSNLLPDHIRERLDARVASRLYRGDNVVCEVVEAPDYCFELKKRRLKNE